MMVRRKATQNGSVHFNEGACYFLLGYYDDDLKLPSIETFIYLGKNLLGELASDERWYFQQAESFVRNGRVVPSKGRDNDDILATPLEHLDQFLDPAQLASLLKKMANESGRHNR
jgi:hypothetical protein